MKAVGDYVIVEHLLVKQLYSVKQKQFKNIMDISSCQYHKLWRYGYDDMCYMS
jgi:hypothetical protein